MTARLERIWVFPIKALDGVSVRSARLTPRGALWGDRRFALRAQDGGFVNGKRTPAVHGLRARFDDDLRRVGLRTGDSGERWFDLEAEGDALSAWFTQALAQPVTLVRDDDGGFPDDTAAPGPTVVSQASLAVVASWFDLPVGVCERRFRTNLVLGGVDSFWEDRLIGPVGQPPRFSVGAITFEGVNPCQRCVVPSRDPETGATTHAFQKRFAAQRRAALPPFAEASRFDHHYRLAVNTRAAGGQADQVLRVGDPVRLR